MSSDEKPFVVVSVLDPAIDTEQMTTAEMVEYARDRDIKRLKFKPGRQPTRYHLREIRHSVWETYVTATDDESVRYRRAFLCAVLKVENLLQRDGGILPEYQHASVPREPALPESEAERYQPRVREEIGMVAFTRSFLGWGTEPVYRVPHTLVPYLEARTYRRAGATPDEQAPSSSAASPASAPSLATHDATPSAASESGSSCATPTAATAAAPATEAA